MPSPAAEITNKRKMTPEQLADELLIAGVPGSEAVMMTAEFNNQVDIETIRQLAIGLRSPQTLRAMLSRIERSPRKGDRQIIIDKFIIPEIEKRIRGGRQPREEVVREIAGEIQDGQLRRMVVELNRPEWLANARGHIDARKKYEEEVRQHLNGRMDFDRFYQDFLQSSAGRAFTRVKEWNEAIFEEWLNTENGKKFYSLQQSGRAKKSQGQGGPENNMASQAWVDSYVAFAKSRAGLAHRRNAGV